MRVCDFLKEDRIIMELKSTEKKSAISEIAALLEGAEEIIDFNRFLSDIEARENLGTTAIGNYAAIPHARTDSVKKFVIAFGRSKEGIEFGAVDGKPAKLIFVMGTPREEGLNDYLRILAHLTRILQKEAFRNELLKAESPSEIIASFQKYEMR